MKIYGKNACLETLKAGKSTIESLKVQIGLKDSLSNTIIRLARESGAKITFLKREILDKEQKNNQGFIMETSEFDYCDVFDILNFAKEKNEDAFILILDGINDPHNLGAIIRTAECCGVHGIIIPKNRSVSVNETVVKVSTGATAYVKIAKVVNIAQTIEKLKESGVFVYALEKGGNNIYKTNLKGKTAIVVGSEGEGVRALNKKVCDDIISIPEFGKINSLNASVATAVAVYEARRQRGGFWQRKN